MSPGQVICISGNLGAGKTYFAKGLALGLGINEHVTSPTFTIINEYEGMVPFYHVDAYRLTDEEEAYELGLEEYLYGRGVTLIEWPDRVNSLLPDEYLQVFISLTDEGDDFRVLDFRAKGQSYEKLVKELTDRVCFGD
jgi:tRNA threonylcarbamoyladenosine biosynthesis protein TsaE